MRINRREMTFLFSGGILILFFLYYLFLLSPALSREKSLKRNIAKREADLARMTELKDKWDRLNTMRKEQEKILSRRGKNFALLSFLEGASRQVGIDKQIRYVKPLPSPPDEPGRLKSGGMEIKLDRLYIKQLVDFLYKIEYSKKLLNIKRIKIRLESKDEARSLDVTLQVE